jgi:hypothetical protein
MSILLANFRQLYQRRGLWLVYLMLGFFIWVGITLPLDEPVAGEGKFIGLIAFAFMVGMLAAMLQMEILTKPFAFCLPGHRRVVREFIFSVGLVTDLLGAMLFLFYPGLPAAWLLAVLCSAFLSGLFFYLAGVWLTFHSRQPLAFIGLLACGLFGGRLFNLHILLERAVVGHPVPVILLGLLCAVAVWRYLNNRDLARRNCLRPWIGFAEVLNREKLLRFQRTRGAAAWEKLKDLPRPLVEAFFMARMRRRGPLSAARFVWGGLYTSFAVMVSQWKGGVLFALFMAVFLGYMGPRMWIVLVFMPIIVCASRPSVYSNMLTAGGRGERFYSTLAVVAAAAGLLSLFIGIAALMSVPLAAVMPEIEYRGLTVAFRAIGIEAFYAPLVLLPLVSAIHLVLYRRQVLMIIVVMLSVYLVMVVGIICRDELAAILNPPTTAALVILCWLIFVLVLYHISMKRCLVK